MKLFVQNRRGIFFLLLFAALGCRQTSVIADEHVGGTYTDTGTDTETETDTGTDTGTDTDEGCGVPTQLAWTAMDMLVEPPEGVLDYKDPTVVWNEDRWVVYASRHTENGFSMIHFDVTDWQAAAESEITIATDNENLTGYKAAPQLFYYSPQQLWYLVYQTPEPAYSTSTDPSDIMSWSAATQFMPNPDFFGEGEGGIDYWIICDETNCYMYFSALNGGLYRAMTTREAFPNGFADTAELVMQESEARLLFDASNVYKIEGTDTYLLLVSAFGGSIGRYYRAWITQDLGGDWTPLAIEEADSLISSPNSSGPDWVANGITHGEMLRHNPDETMTINTCNLQYLFSASQPYDAVTDTDTPNYFSLGLLTATP